MKTRLHLIVFVLLGFSALQAQAKTIRYVKQTGSGDGSSWDNASGDLQGTINVSAASDEVWVAAGTYLPAENTSFAMKEGVKIYGGFVGTEGTLAGRNLAAGNSSILKGNGTRVIYNNSIPGSALTPASVLDGFTITDGNNVEEGGGMYNRYASPTIANCTFSGNTARFYGGAINNYNTLGSPVIDHCTFTGNTAAEGDGGAIYTSTSNNGPVTIRISNSTFSENAANGGFGGAIANNGSTSYRLTATIENCQFLNNSALWAGGAVCDIFANWESTTMIGCLFYGNSAYDNESYGAGSAYYIPEGDVNIINCVFANNKAEGADDDGGAILTYGGTVNITNSTFSNNTSASTSRTGSGALSGIGRDAAVTFNITNCIIYGADAQQVYTDASTNSATVNYNYSLVKGVSATSPNLNVDPVFVNAANPAGSDGIWGTADDGLRLKATSPAVDAGTPDITGLNLPATDITGNLRVQNSTIDMGAYEWDPSALPVRWISFAGHIGEARLATLSWKTEETNAQHYELERSANARDFLTVGIIAAGGNGAGRYSFVDPVPVFGRVYYRIRQVDLDDTFSYSRVISVQSADGIALRGYPNPTRETVTIELDPAYAGSVVRLISATGVVLQEIMAEKQILSIPLDSYPAGVYLLHTADGNVMKIMKE